LSDDHGSFFMAAALTRCGHCRSIAAWSAVMVAVLFCVGWPAGYRSAESYLGFWLSVTGVVSVAATIVRRGYDPRGLAELLVRTGVAAFAIIVLTGLVLGQFGAINGVTYCAVGALLLAVALVLRSAPSLEISRAFADLPPFIVGIAAALLVFVLSFAMTHAPMTQYDSLSYHLYFPARWLQEHRLSIIATPFSDEAQAYAPASGELLLLWLMAPFHGDLVARFGQFPFALLGAASVYALARYAGASRAHAVYPAVFFLFCRQVFEQAMGANVDLICASMFVASLYLAVAGVDSGRRRDWLLFGIAFGLYAGTKYVALIYVPVLLFVVLARGWPKGIAWALPGVVVFGLVWYLRNWIVAGSPIYPASLQAAGVTLASGAFDRAAMLNSEFHTDEFRLFPIMAARLFGPTLFLAWIPFAAVGAVRSASRGWWPNCVLLLVPVLMIPLYWFGLPVNIDSRFLLPAIGPALLPLAFVFGDSRRSNAGVAVLYVVALAWIATGVHARIPARVPWFMDGWLALDGLVQAPFLTLFGALAAALTTALWFGRRSLRVAVPACAILAGITSISLALGASRWCAGGCEYLDTTSAFLRPGFVESWRWVREHVHDGTVAYTGNNLPYPLFGDRLTNRVLYANINSHRRWRLHDYDRAYRNGTFTPLPPLLAMSSGELRAIPPGSGPRRDASRPRYERLEGFREGWIANLQALGVTHLFVAALGPSEIAYVWHDDGGFPIEDTWAVNDPDSFKLLYANRQARVYAVTLAKTGTSPQPQTLPRHSNSFTTSVYR
jgi:hypothetical protein